PRAGTSRRALRARPERAGGRLSERRAAANGGERFSPPSGVDLRAHAAEGPRGNRDLRRRSRQASHVRVRSRLERVLRASRATSRRLADLRVSTKTILARGLLLAELRRGSRGAALRGARAARRRDARRPGGGR